MMKKISAITTLLLAITLVGCGGTVDVTKATGNDTLQNAENTISDSVGTSDPEGSKAETTGLGAIVVDVGPATYECVLDNGVSVTLGQNASDAIAALTEKLGKELDFMEAASCVHPGSDKVYTFDGFTVTTSPDASGNEYVAELSFLSDAVGFDNGIMIGSADEDVTAAFGDKFEEKFGVRKYDLNGVTLTITFTNGAVSAMSISTAA